MGDDKVTVQISKTAGLGTADAMASDEQTVERDSWDVNSGAMD
jgi:hypothetical protein